MHQKSNFSDAYPDHIPTFHMDIVNISNICKQDRLHQWFPMCFKLKAESIQCPVRLSNDVGQTSELKMSVIKPIAVTPDKRPCRSAQTL